MNKKLTAIAAAAFMLAAVHAQAADIAGASVKFTHQNVHGSQSCYTDADCIETEITEIPDVVFGMRINKPVFRAYVSITAEAGETVTLRAEQYNAKGKLIKSDTKEIQTTAGTAEYQIDFDHVRNTESIKLFVNDSLAGSLGSTEDDIVYLSDYPSDYEIYQRGENNKAEVTFAGNSGPIAVPPPIGVTDDGTVFIRTAPDGSTVYNAEYSEGRLVSVKKAVLLDGNAKFDSIAIGSKLLVWNDNQEPVCDAITIDSYYSEQSAVTIKINDTAYTVLPDSFGNFSFTAELDPGLYDAVITCGSYEKEIKQFGVGDIWVAAGQSNMTDMGALTDGFDPNTQDPIPDTVHIIYPEDVTWQKMTHPAGEGRFFKSGMRTSPVTSFARKLTEELDVPIGIVQSSVGGTNIYQWAEGIKPGDENDGCLGRALKACFDNKASNDIKGIIWYQGCNDTMTENYAYNYEFLCDTIFSQFRSFFGGNVPIITTQINDANQDSTGQLGYYDAWSYVKDVQRRYPETHENVYVIGTGANDLGDTIHNSAASNLRVGGAWADMALNKVYGKTEISCEHPTLDTAKITGDNEITLTFKNVGSEGLYIRTDTKRLGITNGLVTIQLGDLKKEFTVRMGGDTILTASNKGKGTESEILSAELTDDNKVILTTADVLNGNIAVDCCYGKRFVPSLTDKVSGYSVLSFYNVKAEYPDAVEPEAPVSLTAADTAYLRQDDDNADASKMFLNGYKGLAGNAAMKFNFSAQPVDKAHLQSAALNVYTTAIGKDRTGNITVSEIGTEWDNTAKYSTFNYSSLSTISAVNTNTAGLFPVGAYSSIDITDFVKNAGTSFGIGIGSDYASDCSMAGISSENPPKITLEYGRIVEISVKSADGAPAPGTKLTISGKRSTQYPAKEFTADENGKCIVILKSGDYIITTEAGEYAAASAELAVRGEDGTFELTLEKNSQIPASVVISGGETEVRESQTEKVLKPFTAQVYDADGRIINGAVWTWSITPEIKAVVSNGVVTTNSHAIAGDVLTLTAAAEFNGKTVSSEVRITITAAGDITYSFNEYQLAKVFDTSDASGITVGNEGLTAGVSSAGNYTNIALMSSADKSGAGYFPIGDTLSAPGYYLFLGAGGNSGVPTYVINLPEPAGSGKYINIRYAKPECTNNGSTNRTQSAADSEKKITIGSTVINVQADCEYGKWYTTSIQLDSGVSAVTVSLGKWGGLAIDHISVTNKPESDQVIIPEGSDAIKVMALGDSITDGYTIAGGYRNTLCSLIESDGLSEAVDFIGSGSNGTGYDKDHEGHSGWAIDAVPSSEDIEGRGRKGLTENIDIWTSASKPDMVLLMIGTNDVLSLYRMDEAPARLETLIGKIKNNLAEVGRIYLATIPYISENAAYNKTGKTQAELDAIIDSYNASIKEIAAADDNITLADVNAQLTLSDLQDGIHPNSGGYAKMGNFWYSILKQDILTRIDEMNQ
ncbi:MAG: sialate O-acetylesterase [bacterium]|nr:sialate O-acetylesterase [bacterium]